MICKLIRRFRRKQTRRVVYVTYRKRGFKIMPVSTIIKVPLAASNEVAVATFEQDLLFGDKAPADAQESITYATGGLFTHVVNADATVTFTAAATTTEGQSDTITVTDDEGSDQYTVTAAADSVTGIELEGVTYSHAPAAAAAGAAGTGTAAGSAS